MADFLNTFSWSPSRARLFDHCARAYYHNHYGMWGGWGVGAPERARLAYRLKHVASLPMWGGSIVHRIIEEELGRLSGGAHRQGAVELKARARAQMIEDWRQSKAGGWKRDPKRCCNLFEHYYAQPEEQVAAASIRVRERVDLCLQQFSEGGVLDRLLALGPAAWLSKEKLEQFPVGDVPVWVQLDLALAEGNGLTLIDWKTGESGESDDEQLSVYALFAAFRWPEIPATDVATELHYLVTGEVRRLPVDLLRCSTAAETITASAKAMRSMLRDPAANLAVEEDFPLQPVGSSRCRTCRFRQLCDR